MANQYKNKIVYGHQTLIDLTQDTITADKLLVGYTAHDASGASITGTCNGVFIPIPASGTNSFWVAVPNGVLNPDPTNDNDWIKLIFTVDTAGNSDVTEDGVAANGVKF